MSTTEDEYGEYDAGFDVVQKVVKEQNERRANSGSFKGLSYWGWLAPTKQAGAGKAEGDPKVMRLLHDKPVIIKMHSRWKWPDGKFRDFVCPNELKGNYPADHPDKELAGKPKAWPCPLRNNEGKHPRPTEVGLALAAYREEQEVDGKLVPVDWFRRNEDGSPQELTLRVPDPAKPGQFLERKDKNVQWIGLVKQSVGNFWDSFRSYYARYGSIVDRDYLVSRTGADNRPNYNIIPLEPVEGLRTEAEVREHYKVPLMHHMTIKEYIESYGSKGYYSACMKGSDEGGDSNESTQSTSQSSGAVQNPEPENTANDTEFQASSLRDELMSFGKQ